MSKSGKIFQLSNKLYENRIPFIPRLLQALNRIIFSCETPPNPKVHPSVVFLHNGLGMVIHEKCSIGKDTCILQNVTIGGNRGKSRLYKGDKIGAPIIGENVFIGAGASVLGPVIIGDNAQIGAGAVVVNDIPKNAVAVGVPAKVIKVLSDKEVKPSH